MGPFRSRVLGSAPTAPFTVLTRLDAYDAVEASRPDDFLDGVMVVLLDEDRRPRCTLLADGAPPDQLDPVAETVCEAITASREASTGTSRTGIDAVVLGIVRSTPARPHASAAEGVRPGQMWLRSAELRAWSSFAAAIAATGAELVDVIVLEPAGWCSVHEAVPSVTDGLLDPDWFEDA